MPQTNLTAVPPKALPGLLDHHLSGVTGFVDEADGIPAGVLVIRGSGGDYVAELPDGTATLGKNVLGVAIHSHDAGEVYDDETEIPCLRHGRIWVVVEDAFTPASNVFVRKFATGDEQLGAFRTNADGTDAIALTAAKFLTSGGAGDFGLLEINL